MFNDTKEGQTNSGSCRDCKFRKDQKCKINQERFYQLVRLNLGLDGVCGDYAKKEAK